ncbi:MAG: porin [bacterium]|nr:porin [bacterium]
MRKVLKLVLLVVLLTSLSQMVFAAAGDWTFSGTNWLRTRVINKDLQGPLKDTDKTTDAGFSVDRGYVRYAYQFTDTIKGQWTADFFSAKTGDFKDGAGIKLKESYIDLPFYLPESKVTIGLQKNYIGLIYDYDYRLIEKEFIDKNGIDASADNGIILNGYFPMGYGSYEVGVYNGEGYKKELSPDMNTEPALVADARFIPVPGITVGASYKSELQGAVGSTGNTAYNKNQLAIGMLRTACGPFDMWAEYIDQKINNYSTTTNTYTDVKKKGFSIMPSYQVNPEWTVLARYDSWDPNTDKANDKVNTTILGVNYTVTKGVLLQLNYQQDKPEDSAVATTTQYLAQIAWSFSRVFVQ